MLYYVRRTTLAVLTFSSGIGCSSLNSNGRRYKETSSIHVVQVQRATRPLEAVDTAGQVALALASLAIDNGAKKYVASSEADLLWTHGFSRTNPALIAIVRTFEPKAEFTTDTLKESQKTLRDELASRLGKFDYAVPPGLENRFFQEMLTAHGETSKVSFVALFLAYSPFEDEVMNLSLLG